MADGTVIGLAITTASSVLLGGGALWRSMRQDTRQADQVKTDTAVAALQKQVDLLLGQVKSYMESDVQLRADLNTERRERSESEARLRRERTESEARLNAQIAELHTKVERCEADRAELIRDLAAATTKLAGQEGATSEPPPTP